MAEVAGVMIGMLAAGGWINRPRSEYTAIMVSLIPNGDEGDRKSYVVMDGETSGS